MKFNTKILHFKNLYIFFIFLSLNIFFFSTVKSEAKAFDINNIDISRPFEIDFNKNEVINAGFKKAFFELISSILSLQASLLLVFSKRYWNPVHFCLGHFCRIETHCLYP